MSEVQDARTELISSIFVVLVTSTTLTCVPICSILLFWWESKNSRAEPEKSSGMNFWELHPDFCCWEFEWIKQTSTVQVLTFFFILWSLYIFFDFVLFFYLTVLAWVSPCCRCCSKNNLYTISPVSHQNRRIVHTGARVNFCVIY